MPSGESARIVSASASGGSAVTRQPRSASRRMMLYFTPSSTTTTWRWGSSDSHSYGSSVLTPRTRSRSPYFGAERRRASASSGVSSLVSAPIITPAVRSLRVRARVSTPAIPGTFSDARYSPSVCVERQCEGASQASCTTSPATCMRFDSTSSALIP